MLGSRTNINGRNYFMYCLYMASLKLNNENFRNAVSFLGRILCISQKEWFDVLFRIEGSRRL